eukprot:gene14272-56426_t
MAVPLLLVLLSAAGAGAWEPCFSQHPFAGLCRNADGAALVYKSTSSPKSADPWQPGPPVCYNSKLRDRVAHWSDHDPAPPCHTTAAGRGPECAGPFGPVTQGSGLAGYACYPTS